MIGDTNDDAVLKAMKDSGVVSDMEQKLSGGRGLLSEERSMLLSFIEEYKVDNKKEVSSKHVMDIVEKVVSNRKPNLPQILVQLGPVMDVLAKLEKGTKRIDIIIGQFSEVLESDKSTKEIFHLFKKFLDKEVLKQSIHDHPKEPKRKNKAPSPSTGLLDTLLQEFFKNKNPAELMSVMNGDVSAISNLLGGTDLLGILKTVVNSYFSSSPYGPIIQQYATMFLESEQGRDMMDSGSDFMASVAASESGRRVLALAPQLLAAKDTQTMMEILGKEVEYNWRLFFTKIVHSNYKDEFVNTLAEAAVRVYDYFKNPPKNSPVNQMPIIINGFLLSYKLPAYDPKTPAKSVAAVINKAIKLFTTFKFDAAPYIEQSYSTVVEALSKHVQEAEYRKLSVEGKVELVSGIIEAEVVQPVLKVWTVYSQAADQPKCATQFLCEINRKERSVENKKVGVVKAASYAASWTLSKASQETYWKLYHAINAGSMGADCEKSYPNTNCVLRDRIFSHNEL